MIEPETGMAICDCVAERPAPRSGAADLLTGSEAFGGTSAGRGLAAEGGSGVGFLEKADVLLADDQGRFAVAGEGARHAQSRGEAGQSFLGLGDPEADVHVPHLVAFPGVDAAAPDLDALFGHLHAPPTLEKRREP